MYLLPIIYKTLFNFHSLPAKTFAKGYALPPIQLMIEITSKCNLNCNFCFYRNNKKDFNNNFEELNLNKCLKIISNLKTCKIISISGGEPFMVSWLPELLKKISSSRLISIDTNGTLINKYNANSVIKAGKGLNPFFGIYNISVSIHGTSNIHNEITRTNNSYKNALLSLSNLVNAKSSLNTTIFKHSSYNLPFFNKNKVKLPFIGVKIVLTKNNIHCLSDTVKEIIKTDIDLIVIKSVDHHTIKLFPNQSSLIEKNQIDLKEFYPELDEIKYEILQTIQLCKKSNTALHFIPMIKTNDFINIAAGKINLQFLTCKSLWSRINVNPYGFPYLCKQNTHKRIPDNYFEIWNSDLFTKFRYNIAKNGLNSSCKGCCFIENSL